MACATSRAQTCAAQGAEAAGASDRTSETAQATEEDTWSSSETAAFETGNINHSKTAPSGIGVLESQFSAKEQLSADAT
ncbi:MAG: hypothetical protein OEV27_16105 [Nitrospira sp.]|nr:hypothetical protein [Nitrospira sp.]MDH4252702.1 hypothetical protein [Nitrospira sp.]MDH4344598.1 hypothetical protein [Nitrospira sp.]MDH5337758.1 hypothetical protein [Nitrospira sp.]